MISPYQVVFATEQPAYISWGLFHVDLLRQNQQKLPLHVGDEQSDLVCYALVLISSQHRVLAQVTEWYIAGQIDGWVNEDYNWR